MIKKAFQNSPVRSGSEEAMVKKLRQESTFNPRFSRVAVKNNEVIGHIILSQVYIVNERMKTPVLNVGLVSVAPDEQRQGIGKRLMADVLMIAKDEGEEAVIVLGHPTYYAQLGFERASNWGITLPFQAPDEAFFARELVPSSLAETTGTVEYTPALFGE